MPTKLSRSDIQDSLERVYEVTNYSTQTTLAKTLEVRQSSISDAKKRGAPPASWLIKP